MFLEVRHRWSLTRRDNKGTQFEAGPNGLSDWGASGFWGHGPKKRAAQQLSTDAIALYWLETEEVNKKNVCAISTGPHRIRFSPNGAVSPCTVSE